MISLSAQYAVRAAMHVARGGAWHTSEEIARATAIPPGYIAKILNLLTRSRILESQRGSHGGFRVVRDPWQVTLYEVVRSVDPPSEFGSCRECESPSIQGCGVNRIFAEIDHQAETRLRNVTIGRLLQDCA